MQPRPRDVGPPSRCALSQPPPPLPPTSRIGACRQHQCRRHGAPERRRGVERRSQIGSRCRSRWRQNGRGERDATSPPPSARPSVLDDPQSRRHKGELLATVGLAGACQPQGEAGELPSPGSIARGSSSARGAPSGARRPEMVRPVAGRSWRSSRSICSL
jgi:hypothetical protein